MLPIPMFFFSWEITPGLPIITRGKNLHEILEMLTNLCFSVRVSVRVRDEKINQWKRKEYSFPGTPITLSKHINIEIILSHKEKPAPYHIQWGPLSRSCVCTFKWVVNMHYIYFSKTKVCTFKDNTPEFVHWKVQLVHFFLPVFYIWIYPNSVMK